MKKKIVHARKLVFKKLQDSDCGKPLCWWFQFVTIITMHLFHLVSKYKFCGLFPQSETSVYKKKFFPLFLEQQDVEVIDLTDD